VLVPALVLELVVVPWVHPVGATEVSVAVLLEVSTVPLPVTSVEVRTISRATARLRP